ncbi:putative rhomboid protease [Saccharomycopsis crataegensis]|uniref:Rhomboid-type serine protease 2 n=1 Tax=Saccharomycopsis crataegensis TaxID=43959 RepID=A0AAV5QL31_9ASCO|nr:putative rhomboid protease [Saccharomycopsis crataegensis]
MDSFHHATVASITRQLFPQSANGKFAALASGLSVFLVLIFFVSFFTGINDAIALNPKSLFYFNLGRLSNYPLGHLSLLHLILNVVALYGPLARFEMVHGTVYTGIVLNVLAMATAIPFCIVGIVLFRDVHVIGASGWVFSFAAYFAYRESLNVPVFRINSNFAVPTLYTPVLFLVVITILMPGSSFWGHLFGLIAGYLLGFGYLDKFIQPPTKKVVPFIESKVDFLIRLIPSQFLYLKEEATATSRADFYSRNGRTIIPMTEGGANKRQSMPPTPATEAPSGFQGPGHTLNG